MKSVGFGDGFCSQQIKTVTRLCRVCIVLGEIGKKSLNSLVTKLFTFFIPTYTQTNHNPTQTASTLYLTIH